MYNFAEYITPEKAKEIEDERSLEELRSAAKKKEKCSNCGEPAWRFADTGLCFSCTTGEWDASEDYELIQE